VTAFVTALRDGKETELRAILWPEGDCIIDSGDRYADRELHERFIALYDEKLAIDLNGPGCAELDVGANDCRCRSRSSKTMGVGPSTQSGAQTIVDRRISRNELSAIRTLLAGVDPERDYFDRTKQMERASTSHSWSARRGTMTASTGRRERKPAGSLDEHSTGGGYPGDLVGGKPIPYEGYYFRILSSQGPNADGGIRSYLRSGRMTGGFAFIAWPAVFGSTGIMTFIVAPDGDVYQRDLASEANRIARAMTSFDPDLSWSRVDVTNE
jgi:hypothetical protein